MRAPLRTALGAVLSSCLGFAVGSLPGGAQAQSLGANGSRIQTNDYSIDLYQGPVLASTRVIGLGGAYVAVAEFVEGNTQNPAAPGVRAAHSLDYYDWDAGIGFTFPSTVSGSDFFNTGKQGTSLLNTDEQGFVFFEVAGNFQFGHWGIGLGIRAQEYGLARADDGGDELESQIGGLDLQIARGFLDGQLVFGLGATTGGLQVFNRNAENQAEGTLFNSVGGNYALGALIRPNESSYRIGAAVRGKIESVIDETITRSKVVFQGTPEELYLPDSVIIPWEVAVGFAYQFGRVFNPTWFDPTELVEGTERYVAFRRADRERRREWLYATAEKAGGDVGGAKAAIDAELDAEAALDEASLEQAVAVTRERLKARIEALKRFYFLVTTALIIDGPAKNAVGIESFLERTVNRSGEVTTLSPRLGVETEAVPGYVVARAGTYLEPSRFASNPDGARLHGTLGADLRLGTFSVFGLLRDDYTWRLRGAADVARDYFGWGVALGAWY